MPNPAGILQSTPLRTKRPRGRSGKILIGAGLAALTLGLFTGTLDRRLSLAGRELSVLEVGVVLVGAAVALAFVRYLLRKLRRAAGYGLLGGIGLGVGIGLPALVAIPVVGGLAKRLGSSVYGALPWFGPSRWERLLAAVGGPRGLASGCYGTVLLTAGAATGSLGDEYVVFGHRLSLLAVFGLLAVPGIVVYYSSH